MSQLWSRASSVVSLLWILSLPLHAQNTDVPEGYESFEAYETAMFVRIDELAAQNGLNVEGLHAKRNELQIEYEDARNQDDATGMAEARAMQSYVIRVSLEKLSQATSN